ncbi:MAG: dTDP-4-dehydrorhamnose reductase [Bacteroidales bacterium]|nr:dTDP-4-dehydrorhamnose reductase [Candidatus Cacconaster caballi]
MNILVTGAGGQLGNEMQIVSRQTADTYFFTDVCDGHERLDITDLESVRAFVREHGVQAIVNCAAWTNVDGAEDPAKFELVEALNATAPENLAIAMKEVGGLLVHISTDYVFGREPYNVPCREDQTGTPTGVYGLTKLHGEQAIQRVFASQSGKGDAGAFVIIRTAWLYSEFGKNFCKTMLNLTATKPELKVVFDQVGTPTYALDLAKAITVVLADYSRHAELDSASHYANSGIYHFSNEGVCSWYDFTKMIQHYSGQNACNVLPCHSSEFPSPVTRPAYSVLDKTKIKETFGVEVPYWTDSLLACIDNFRKL